MMELHLDVDLGSIPFETEQDPDTGQVTVFNDDLQVMAIASSTAEAHERFQAALIALAEAEVAAGRPLPEVIQSRIYA